MTERCKSGETPAGVSTYPYDANRLLGSEMLLGRGVPPRFGPWLVPLQKGWKE
jgi:hypothetical protein